MPTLTLRITGKVQGVWYRGSTRGVAEELGLTGFACNEEDGSVTVKATGEKAKLEKLMKWCRQGPAGAEVESVAEKWSETEESFAGFEAR